MRRKIALALLVIFACSSVGIVAALVYVERTTDELGRLSRLHRIGEMRQHLVIASQTAQAELYKVNTPLGESMDAIAENVLLLEEAARAVLAALPFRLGLVSARGIFLSQPLAVILYTLLSINLVLAVFNLIPVPPLDGSKILAMLLPAQYDNVMATLTQYGPFILLFMILPVFGGQSAVSLIVTPIVTTLTRLLLGI